MPHIYYAIDALFILTTIFAIWLFYSSTGRYRPALYLIVVVALLQSVAAFTSFYQRGNTSFPKFVLLPAPGLLVIIFLLITRKGRAFLDRLDIRKLTLLHIIRVPVEIVLLYLCLKKLVPVLMTFEGRNLDILSGLSSPLIYYLVFIARKGSRKLLLTWNIICLGLLINILVIAVLSAPTPFQRLAFDQPNTGITYFPFVWLPSILVPLVFIAHVAAIRRLVRKGRKEELGMGNKELG